MRILLVLPFVMILIGAIIYIDDRIDTHTKHTEDILKNMYNNDFVDHEPSFAFQAFLGRLPLIKVLFFGGAIWSAWLALLLMLALCVNPVIACLYSVSLIINSVCVSIYLVIMYDKTKPESVTMFLNALSNNQKLLAGSCITSWVLQIAQEILL